MIDESYKEELLNTALVEHESKNFLNAKSIYLQITKLYPEDFYPLFLLGTLEIDLQNYSSAALILEKSLQINPEYLDTCLNLGFVYTSIDRYDDAIKVYYDAVNSKKFDINIKSHEKIIRRFARINIEIGNRTEGIKLYWQILKHFPDDFQIYNLLHEMKAFKFNKSFISKIKKFLKNKKIPHDKRVQATFLLSKYEREKQNFKSEFLLLKEAHGIIYDNNKDRFNKVTSFYLNKLGNLDQSYDHSIELKSIKKKRMSVFPIFIVGLPRSGSTILEKVISSGSKSLVPGEETAIMHILFNEIFINSSFKDNIDDIAEAIVSQYEKKGLINSKINQSFIDKSLENYFCLGWIMKIFPNAKIINIKKDPLASMVSIFRRNLFNTTWAHRIEDISKYMNSYYELISKWETKFQIPIYHLNYEKFIEDFDGETKKLFKHLSLDWHEKVKDINNKGKIVSKTASTIQIREPIYTKLNKDYEDLSKFMIKNLEQYDWYQRNKV